MNLIQRDHEDYGVITLRQLFRAANESVSQQFREVLQQHVGGDDHDTSHGLPRENFWKSLSMGLDGANGFVYICELMAGADLRSELWDLRQLAVEV